MGDGRTAGRRGVPSGAGVAAMSAHSEQLSLFDAVTIGRERAREVSEAAERRGFDQGGAEDYIVGYVSAHGPTSGEDLVMAAKDAGHRGHDDRCFGSVFLSAIRGGRLVVLRSDLPRRRGHGTSGGRLYGVPGGRQA